MTYIHATRTLCHTNDNYGAFGGEILRSGGTEYSEFVVVVHCNVVDSVIGWIRFLSTGGTECSEFVVVVHCNVVDSVIGWIRFFELVGQNARIRTLQCRCPNNDCTNPYLPGLDSMNWWDRMLGFLTLQFPCPIHDPSLL